jgi:hypothetical protein
MENMTKNAERNNPSALGSVIARILNELKVTRREREMDRLKAHLSWDPLQLAAEKKKKRRR